MGVSLLFQLCHCGGHGGGGGGGHKKVIIHVPYKVNTVHHTHTVVKHVDGGGDESYSKVIGVSGDIGHGEIQHGGHHEEDLGTYGGGHGFGLIQDGGHGGHDFGGHDLGGGHGGFEGGHGFVGGHDFGGGHIGGGFGGGHGGFESGHGGDWAGGASYSEGGDFGGGHGGFGGHWNLHYISNIKLILTKQSTNSPSPLSLFLFYSLVVI